MTRRQHISADEKDIPRSDAIVGGLLSGLSGACGGAVLSMLLGGRTALAPVDAEMIAFTFAGAAIGSVLGWHIFQRWLRAPHRHAV